MAIIFGVGGVAREYAKRSVKAGVPTLVVDEGWLRIERGFWQVSPKWINSDPPRAPDTKRFEALQLLAHPPVKRDYASVIVGELAGDPRHDLTTDLDVVHWAQSAAEQIRAVKQADRRHRIYWRPHKHFIRSLGRPTILTQHDRLVSELVDNDFVGSAVVYNSQLGLDLLRNGVRVVAQGPRTVYTDLVPSDISSLPDAHPGVEKVRELLERLAYGQYKAEELADWRTLERLLALHEITGDW